MLELNKIYNEDCLTGMKQISDKSINLIVIDPPYNIGIAKWDKINNYIDWMSKVFLECQRVLKDNGSFYWFHNDMMQIYKLMESLENNTSFKFEQMIVWDKFNGTPPGYKGKNAKYNNQRNWAKCAEYCFYYTFQNDINPTKLQKEFCINIKEYFISERKKIKQSLTWINRNILGYTNGKDGMAGNILSVNKKGWSFPTEEQYNKLKMTGNFNRDYIELKKEYDNSKCDFDKKYKATFNDINLPSIWQCPPEPPNGHITPKPLYIIDNIIKASSDENDVICDCFMGSATTAISCLKNNRKFLGFENNEKYFNLSNKRIDKYLYKLKSAS